MDIFWIYKPSIIFQNYYEIIPTSQMTRIKQMNIVSRLLIYLIILTLLFDKDSSILIISLTMLILIMIFYFISKTDIVGVGKDIIKENKDEIERYTSFNEKCKDCPTDYDTVIKKSLTNIYDNAIDPVSKAETPANILVESGYIDFDGNYKIGRDYSTIKYSEINQDKKPKISYDKNKFYTEQTCRKPTADNPFANIVFSDYLDAGSVPEPCNIDNKDVQTSMQNLYNSSIYRNIDDVFERENSQRIFYTVPITTIPNKQTEFANWLYKSGPTCKENSANCTYYEEPLMVSPRY